MNTDSSLPYSVLLYYCYTDIADPDLFREEHHDLCLKLDLRGRIIIASEGLNGTVSGLQANCEAYMKAVKADPRFKDTDFKVEYSSEHAFPKLNVRVKEEIVNSSLKHIHPGKQPVGKHLEPEQLKEMLDDPDVVLLDVRSNYEHNLGRFKGAVTLDIDNFRDFPDAVKELEDLKGKKVVTYCTGGIKCEKASAYLLEQGFKDVYQLHGGIIKYGLEAGGENFDGLCYVFDHRVATEVNVVNPTVVGKCCRCGGETNKVINCANPHCNTHTTMCEICCETYQGACKDECFEDPDRRPWDGTGAYPKKQNGYNPFANSRRIKKGERFTITQNAHPTVNQQ